MPQKDSVDKIVTSYFACVTAEPFTYKGKQYEPKPLRVSPLLFRGFTCPASCGACCSRFSLDYLPESVEPHPYPLSPRAVAFDGREIEIWSDGQDDHDSHHCRNLRKDDGRCNIHGSHPFSCDFELIRFMVYEDENKPNRLLQRLYGRKHAMLQVDGETRGTMCEMLPPDPHRVAEVFRKLGRLKQWCDHFGLKHKVDQLVEELQRLCDQGQFSFAPFTVGSEVIRRKPRQREADPTDLEPFPVELMLDSGAFGAWTRKETIDVNDYIAFVREYGHLFHSVVNLDVIPGEFRKRRTPQEVEYAAEASYANLQAMREARLSPIPVFHQGEQWRHLERMLDDGETYIGISPSGDEIEMDEGWFEDVFDRITDADGFPLVKTHGFGVTSFPILMAHPWFSADSLTWVIMTGNGNIYLPQEVEPGVFDYSKKPETVKVTKLEKWKGDFDRLERFVTQELKTDLVRMCYDTDTRREAVAFYFRELSRHLHYKPHKRTSPPTQSGDPVVWPMKKIIFATGPLRDRRHHSLTRLGIRERLVSYYDLRNAPPEDIFRYAKYGVAGPPPKPRKSMTYREAKTKKQQAEKLNRFAIFLANHIDPGFQGGEVEN